MGAPGDVAGNAQRAPAKMVMIAVNRGSDPEHPTSPQPDAGRGHICAASGKKWFAEVG